MHQARFDDLTPGRERSFRLVRPVRTVVAHEASAVAGALDQLGSARDHGLWAAGFLAYEAAPGLDPVLRVRSRRPSGDPFERLPLLWFALFEDREPVPALHPLGRRSAGRPLRWRASIDRARYDEAVTTIRERIAAGDTYQVNHTFRLRTRFEGDPTELYRDLCLAQRGGYAALLEADRYVVLSASPELFLRVDGDRITTRPMKGTAPRGRWPGEDSLAADALRASAKDRAENAMIVDLIRNDLGRVAEPGTVAVEAMFEAERYETVWQLTSTVTATMRPRTPLREVLAALFPSGSVTGAPKVATMELIRRLEDSPRGVYCGAVGYLAPEGSGEPAANLNVAIRTVVLDRDSGTAEYGVGGGVTYDSSAAGEYREALAKARVLVARRPDFELIETMLHRRDQGFRHQDEHRARLEASAAYFGFAFDAQTFRTYLEKARAELGGGDGIARLQLARDGAIRLRTAPPPDTEPHPVRVALDRDPLDPADVWLFHKTTLRERYERRRASRPDAADVLLVNTRGEVTESTVANLAVLTGAGWVTPPVDCGLLPGTYREVLVREGKLVERPVSVEELRAAPRIGLVSSVRGWREAWLLP